METPEILITGIGSVSSLGPVRGLVGAAEPTATAVTRWPTQSQRRAYMVPSFKPNSVVPGLRARRLDHLSVWAVVAAYLAMQDAEVDSDTVSPSRVAIVFGTGFGCLELSEAYLESVNRYGYGATDPIIFPETLANAPAGHIARTFGFRGPNITLSCRGISGESALIQARSLLIAGEADKVIVVSGDMLTRPLFEWYEAASVLSVGCFEDAEVPIPFSPECDGLFPGEGVAAMVLEPGARRNSARTRAYAEILGGLAAAEPGVSATSWGRSPAPTVELIRRLLGARELHETKLVIASANGSGSLDQLEAEILRSVFGDGDRIAVAAPKAISGEFEASGILRLALALSGRGTVRNVSAIFPPRSPSLPPEVNAPPEQGLAMLIGTSAGGGRAAILLRLFQNARRESE